MCVCLYVCVRAWDERLTDSEHASILCLYVYIYIHEESSEREREGNKCWMLLGPERRVGSKFPPIPHYFPFLCALVWYTALEREEGE